MFAPCRPQHVDLLQFGTEHPKILTQIDPSPVDLSVADIRAQIAADGSEIAQWSQWRAAMTWHDRR